MKTIHRLAASTNGRASRPGLEIHVAACLSALILLSGCGAKGPDSTRQPEAENTESGYVQAPRLTAVTLSDTTFLVHGTSAKGARVRLSSPDGQAFGATASDSGTWLMEVPRGASTSSSAMLFGLSEDMDGRIIQAEGYVALLPDPLAPMALLRAGTGAETLVNAAPFVITAADFDDAGGLNVSGFAPAGKPLKGSLDGVVASEGRAGPDRRFSLGLSGPARPGLRQVDVRSGANVQTVTLDLKTRRLPAGTLFSTAKLADWWRIDWTTPSGGVQTTLIKIPSTLPKP